MLAKSFQKEANGPPFTSEDSGLECQFARIEHSPALFLEDLLDDWMALDVAVKSLRTNLQAFGCVINHALRNSEGIDYLRDFELLSSHVSILSSGYFFLAVGAGCAVSSGGSTIQP
jgi:hypothetical protein